MGLIRFDTLITLLFFLLYRFQCGINKNRWKLMLNFFFRFLVARPLFGGVCSARPPRFGPAPIPSKMCEIECLKISNLHFFTSKAKYNMFTNDQCVKKNLKYKNKGLIQLFWTWGLIQLWRTAHIDTKIHFWQYFLLKGHFTTLWPLVP